MTANLIEWLNDEASEVILQRDNTYAMLTWRDFNQPAEIGISMHTVAWTFILMIGVPVLMMS